MVKLEEAHHGPDFASVEIHGIPFNFTSMQARIVEILWLAAENGTPDVKGCTLILGACSGLQEDRIGPLFFRNPAWKTFVVPGKRRGTYRLNFEKTRLLRLCSAKEKIMKKSG
jgi:hypothetical protein